MKKRMTEYLEPVMNKNRIISSVVCFHIPSLPPLNDLYEAFCQEEAALPLNYWQKIVIVTVRAGL
jgi:hypothetical protein